MGTFLPAYLSARQRAQEAQQRQAELMQQQLFQQQQNQYNRNNPSAYEKFEMDRANRNDAQNIQDKQLQNQIAIGNQIKSGAWVETDRNRNDLADVGNEAPTPTSPAQKAMGGFDFRTAGQAAPAATSPGDNLSTPGQSAGNSGASPGAPTPHEVLFGVPSNLSNGAITPTSASASQGQTGALGQASVGSTTPSQTSAGQTGKDSGPSPIQTPPQQPQLRPDITIHDPSGDPTKDRYFRNATPDELNIFNQKQALANAVSARKTKVADVDAMLADPANQDLFGTPEGKLLGQRMRASAQSGMPVPPDTLTNMGEALQAAIARGDTASAASITKAMQAIKPPAGGANSPQMSPEALDMNAKRFIATGGDMVAMGMGNAAIGQRIAIMNRAAELSKDADLAANKGVYKSNTESLAGLTKQHDAMVAFENTGAANLDNFKQQAATIASHHLDTGIPWLNTPWREVANKFGGDPDLPAYSAARQVAISEIAKVLNNPGLTGALTDTARKEISDFNPDNATLAQTLKVADILTTDMENRKMWNESQIQEVGKRLGRGATSLTGPSLGQESPAVGSIKSLSPSGPIQPKPGSGPLPEPPPTPKPLVKGQKLDAATRDKYLQLFHNDRNAAKAAAQNDGWDTRNTGQQ